MESSQKILDNKYIILQRLGSGGEGVAYLVRDIDSQDPNLRLVAKTLEFEGSEDEEEYEDDDEINSRILNVQKIFSKVSEIDPPHPNIIQCIRESKGKIIKDGKTQKNRNYLIFEYAPRGDLWKITQMAGGLGERCAKPIFQKILLGVQALHNIGVYHLDLKVDNIVLGANYIPKICDFGLASLERGFLDYSVGTRNYKPPQMFERHIRYTGEKADIFSLGCVLFALVVKGPWFNEAKRDDYYYKYIYRNQDADIQKYFEALSAKNNAISSLSKEFKDLYVQMIAYDEAHRPSIEQILNHAWFNEIRNLNDEAKKALDNEVRTLFSEKEKRIDDILEFDPHILDQFETFVSSDTRGGNGNERKPTFENDITPKYKNIEFVKGIHYIKLKGKLNHLNFMNKFIDNIIDNFGEENVEVDASSYKYKCDLIFLDKNDKEDEKDDKEGEENEEDDNEIKSKIQLKLYQIGQEEYCLRFLRKLGSLPQYYLKMMKLFELAKKLF